MIDLRQIARTIRRNPLFSLAVTASLAVGIGANTLMFTVVDTLLFRPPQGVRSPSGLLRFYFTYTDPASGESTSPSTSYPILEDFRNDVKSFQNLAGYCEAVFSFGRSEQAREVRGAVVSEKYFNTLGMKPWIGRFFAADNSTTVEYGAVLSYGLWRDQFGEDSAALGRNVLIGMDTYTIIGVAPPKFNGLDLKPVNLWLPLSAAGTQCAGAGWRSQRAGYWLRIIGRLRSEASKAGAAAEATQIYRRVNDESLDSGSGTIVKLGPVQQARGPRGDDQARVALWLAALAAIILAVACLNVAGLHFSRIIHRQPEIAVRSALGATQGRLVGELLGESICLAALGGVGAVLIGVVAAPLVNKLLLVGNDTVDLVVGLRTLCFTGATAVLAGIASGLGPAITGGRLAVRGVPWSSFRFTAGGKRTLRNVFLVAQVALTFALVVAAGLFVRSLRNVRSLRLGFDPDSVLVVSLSLDGIRLGTPEIESLFTRILERVQVVPGVERASLGTAIPFGEAAGYTVWIPRLPTPPEMATGSPYFSAVTPTFFATIGTQIRQGREFTNADRAGAPLVAVVNQTMARFLWPGEEAIGQCIHLGERTAPCVRIVGVAEDIHQLWIREQPRMQFYIPLYQHHGSFAVKALFVRMRESPDRLVASIRAAVQSVDPSLPFVRVETLQDLVAPQIRPWRLGAVVFTGFGSLALVMAGIGLYGVMAYGVRRRVRDIGIRIALGASTTGVLRAVLVETLGLAALGTAIGALAALAIGRGMASMLFGVPPADPLVFVLSIAVIVLATVVASYLPAREAVRVDPIEALRTE